MGVVGWFAAGFGLLGSATFGRAILRWTQKRRLLEALSVGGHCTPVTILRTETTFVAAGAIRRFHLQVPTESGSRTFIDVFQPSSKGPLLLADGRGLALASSQVPSACLLLREDLWPLVLDDDQRSTMLERLEGAAEG